VFQQEAYLAIWRPVDAQNSAIPGAIPQNRRRPVRDMAMQNFTLIGKAPAEKSVIVQNDRKKPQ